VIAAMVIGVAIGSAAMLGPSAAYYTELFPPQVRYSGLGLGRELAGALSGGLAPTVAAALVVQSGGASWPVALLLLTVAVAASAVVWWGPETLQRQPEQAMVLAADSPDVTPATDVAPVAHAAKITRARPTRGYGS
jgi:MFS family permease